MYSNSIKFILVLTGFAPIFLIYWILELIINFKNLHFYVSLDWFSFSNFLSHHYSLFIFLILILLAFVLKSKALHSLPIGSIEVKSIKPADINLNPLLISYFLPLCKFYFTDADDAIFLLVPVIISILYIAIGKNAYHYNLVFRLLFRYKNYEIQTKSEVTYLLLSKTKIVRPDQIKRFVQLSEYMLIHIN